MTQREKIIKESKIFSLNISFSKKLSSIVYRVRNFVILLNSVLKELRTLCNSRIELFQCLLGINPKTRIALTKLELELEFSFTRCKSIFGSYCKFIVEREERETERDEFNS